MRNDQVLNLLDLSKLKDLEKMLMRDIDETHMCEPEEECTIDTPKCPQMQLKAALLKVRGLINPVHKGINYHRTEGGNVSERVFAEEWERENERTSMRFDHGILEILLAPSNRVRPFDTKIERISQRDASVAATVVQWLGTSCGLGFLEECERLCEKERKLALENSEVVKSNRRIKNG